MNGEVVAKVLSGQRSENIPIMYDSNLQVQVDWPALNHWHIPESALPLGAQIQRRPISFWQHYRTYLIIAIILFVMQALVIAALLTQRARKREAETVLRESEERFRVMADATPALVWMCDARGKIAYLNDRWFSFTGAEPGAGLGDTWINYIHPDDVADVLSTFTRALIDRQPFSIDAAKRWPLGLPHGQGGFTGNVVRGSDGSGHRRGTAQPGGAPDGPVPRRGTGGRPRLPGRHAGGHG